MAKTIAFFMLPLFSWLYADIAFNSISPDTWLNVPTLNQYPGYGVDIHPTCDTAGNMYMIGGCTYENVASGSHNSEVYRFDLKTGSVCQVYSDAANPVQISCQCALAYDKLRNCIWFSWANIYDTSGGLYRFQCPNGPITKFSDSTMGFGMYGAYYLYHDPVNDLLIAPNVAGMAIRNLVSGETTHVSYPGSVNYSAYEIPSCFDSKRGLVAITQWGGCWCANGLEPVDPPVLHDIYLYNTTTRQWQIKSPAVTPGLNFGSEMTYDAVNDKYIYFGSGRLGYGLPELWIYDYDSNLWTEVERNDRTYSRSNPTAATWPANRFKHGWTYCEKYNISVNWGGYNYIAGKEYVDSMLTDLYFGAHQPLWYYRLGDGNAVAEDSLMPNTGKTSLAASPNPFNPAVKLAYALPAGSSGKVTVLDTRGRMIREFTLPAGVGTGTVEWNGRDAFNRNVPSGLYVARLMSGSQQLVLKMTLTK